MLGNELVTIGEVVREIPADTFVGCHQDGDEVVHHDGDVDAVDRLELRGVWGEHEGERRPTSSVPQAPFRREISLDRS